MPFIHHRQPIASYAGSKADYVQPGDPLPATVKYDLQPYGVLELENLKLVENNNVLDVYDLIGTVKSGTETAYLFGSRSTQDVPVGTERRIYGLMKRDLADTDVIVRVAM